MGNVTANTPLEVVQRVYARLAERVETGRTRTGRALTLAEKILFNHLQDPDLQPLERGHAEATFYPDHVAMQDATGQMTLLQFIDRWSG
jgi:aconitase (EC 4.2.1.3)